MATFASASTVAAAASPMGRAKLPVPSRARRCGEAATPNKQLKFTEMSTVEEAIMADPGEMSVSVHNTFIHAQVGLKRSPSLEGFFRERQVQTCPSTPAWDAPAEEAHGGAKTCKAARSPWRSPGHKGFEAFRSPWRSPGAASTLAPTPSPTTNKSTLSGTGAMWNFEPAQNNDIADCLGYVPPLPGWGPLQAQMAQASQTAHALHAAQAAHSQAMQAAQAALMFQQHMPPLSALLATSGLPPYSAPTLHTPAPVREPVRSLPPAPMGKAILLLEEELALSPRTPPPPAQSPGAPPTSAPAASAMPVAPAAAAPVAPLGDGELPSVGSAGHAAGDCRPCAFFHHVQTGCSNGANCTFCHLCDAGEKKRRRRQKLEALRQERKERKAAEAAEAEAAELNGDAVDDVAASLLA